MIERDYGQVTPEQIENYVAEMGWLRAGVGSSPETSRWENDDYHPMMGFDLPHSTGTADYAGLVREALRKVAGTEGIDPEDALKAIRAIEDRAPVPIGSSPARFLAMRGLSIDGKGVVTCDLSPGQWGFFTDSGDSTGRAAEINEAVTAAIAEGSSLPAVAWPIMVRYAEFGASDSEGINALKKVHLAIGRDGSTFNEEVLEAMRAGSPGPRP